MGSLGTKANTGALKSEFLPQCVFERADNTSESSGSDRASLEDLSAVACLEQTQKRRLDVWAVKVSTLHAARTKTLVFVEKPEG